MVDGTLSCFVVQNCSANQGLLHFHAKFSTALSICVNCIIILMGIALNLFIAFGRIDIFIFILPIYKHGRSV